MAIAGTATPRRALRRRRRHLLIQATAPKTKLQQADAALTRRDAWLARHADEAVVVWDGDDASVGGLPRSFQDGLGETEV